MPIILPEIIRIADNYFEVLKKPYLFGLETTELIPRKKMEIKEDHGQSFFAQYVKKYNSFCMVPNNIKPYEPESLGKNCYGPYNMFNNFGHQPKQGEWPTIRSFLHHVFKEQLPQGLDYFHILYTEPTWILPVLCLVSKERGTGKSTFLDLLQLMFQNNTVIIEPEIIGGHFNSAYATKNIIVIDETFLEKRESIEKIKSLATKRFINVNQKHVTEYKIPFYGKIVLCSNDVDRFIRIDEEEVRFWVRELDKPGEDNTDILEQMSSEIPAFCYYLLHVHERLNKTRKSRHYFSQDQIQTEAVVRLKEESKSTLYKELKLLFEDFFNNHENIDEVKFTPSDIKTKWFLNNNQISRAYITRVLKEEFCIKPSEKLQRYIPLLISTEETTSVPGKPYTLYRDEDTIDDDLPF